MPLDTSEESSKRRAERNRARLAKVWRHTAAIWIFDVPRESGERFDSKLLAIIDQPNDLTELGHLLEVDRELGRCACYGDISFEFRDRAGSRLALLRLHHGLSLNWEEWEQDLRLVNGRALMEWLDTKGVSGPLEGWLEVEERRKESISQYESWLLEIPAALESLKDQTHNLARTGSFLSAERVDEFDQLLAADVPDMAERAGLLMRWFGTGSGRMTGFPSYEAVPGQLLDRVPIEALVDALDGADDATLDGGVRFLAGWNFHQNRGPDLSKVPAATREALLSRAESSGDKDKLERARRAFLDSPI